jgi:hypothetical protein
MTIREFIYILISAVVVVWLLNILRPPFRPHCGYACGANLGPFRAITATLPQSLPDFYLGCIPFS